MSTPAQWKWAEREVVRVARSRGFLHAERSAAHGSTFAPFDLVGMPGLAVSVKAHRRKRPEWLAEARAAAEVWSPESRLLPIVVCREWGQPAELWEARIGWADLLTLMKEAGY